MEGVNIVSHLSYTSFGGDELFVGRAGYLCGILNLRLKLGLEIINDKVVEQIIRVLYESGAKHSQHHRSPSPLMYSYYDTEYLGAAHGLCAILQVMNILQIAISKINLHRKFTLVFCFVCR